MALSAYALVSLLEAREFLGGETEGQIERITACVNAATEYCERKVGAPIKSRTYTEELLDGSGARDQELTYGPVTAVAGLGFLTEHSPVAWDAVDTVDYPLVVVTPGRRRVAFRNGSFPAGIQNVQVTYTAGYGDAAGLAPLPDLLKQACLQVVKVLYEAKDDDGVSSVTLGGAGGSQTTTYLDRALPKLTLDILHSYRRRSFG